ncbi:hypothetical protein ACTU6U_10910 [Microbacterium sp. A196]|uniref:hypothetical protein n=1 Tax=Microbacterium sp. A196 TaxID=3457320 RepID=UPI003FCFF1D1
MADAIRQEDLSATGRYGEIVRRITLLAPVIPASDTIAQPLSAPALEAAADEIEGYLEPLRELEPQGKMVEPHRLILEGMDEMLIALRAGDSERLSAASSELAKTGVDVEIACR